MGYCGRTAQGRRRARFVFAALICAALLISPAPAAARTVITVEVAFGGVVAGGLSLFIYIGSSWEVPLALRDLPSALIEFSPAGTRLGVPLPRIAPATGPTAPRGDTISFDLLRWRF